MTRRPIVVESMIVRYIYIIYLDEAHGVFISLLCMIYFFLYFSQNYEFCRLFRLSKNNKYKVLKNKEPSGPEMKIWNGKKRHIKIKVK